MLIALHGANLLRIKGILNVAGSAGPVAIHGVQHLFHPPVELLPGPMAIGVPPGLHHPGYRRSQPCQGAGGLSGRLLPRGAATIRLNKRRAAG